MDPKVSVKVTTAEYNAVMRSRIEHVLTTADVPPKIVVALLDCFSQMTTAEEHPVDEEDSGVTGDERQKPHWLRPGQRSIEKPRSVAHLIINALYSKKMCTAPELATLTKKPIKSIYTNLWRLRKDGVIDIGAAPNKR